MQNISIALGKRQLVDSIWKSTGIEGLGTTFPATEAILDNMPVMTTRDEVYFVCNMKRAWEFLFDMIDSEYPNNIMLLSELNKICLECISYGGGDIRTIPVSIGGTKWAPEIPNRAAIIEDVEKINANPDKLEVALDMFCYVARKQMFIDGNKRVSQLICNKILMENDIGIMSVPYERLDVFKEKLIKFYETNDSTDLKNFFKEECLTLVREYDKDGVNKQESEQVEEEDYEP